MSVFTDNGELYYGAMLSLNAVICSLGTVFITEWTKKLKPAKAIQVGGLFYMIGFGSLAFINNLPFLIVSTCIWTIGEILVATNTSVFIANHSPASHRGRFNAIFPMIRRLGSFIGPILTGVLIQYSTYQMMWLIIGLIALMGSVLMGLLNKKVAQVDY
jgi:dipeptide/tripeptide permease